MAEPAPKCFTCGKDLINNPLDNWDKYYEMYDAEKYSEKKTGADMKDKSVRLFLKNKVLDELGYNRICCRRMFLGDTRKLRRNLRLYLNRDK